jgi:hypothetical protein
MTARIGIVGGWGCPSGSKLAQAVRHVTHGGSFRAQKAAFEAARVWRRSVGVARPMRLPLSRPRLPSLREPVDMSFLIAFFELLKGEVK